MIKKIAELIARVLLVVTIWFAVSERVEAGCNLPSGEQFTDPVNVSPQPNNVTVPGFYSITGDLNHLINAALGWFGFGSVAPFDKQIITTRFLVCCPSVIPEPDYGVWEEVRHTISGSAVLSPSISVGVLPSIIANIVGAATGAGVDSEIVTQLQNALNALSITLAGVAASWSGSFMDPWQFRDDCSECGPNECWYGWIHRGLVGTIGSYNNSSWAGETIYNVSVTLIDADVGVNDSSAMSGGMAYRLRTSESRIVSLYRLGLGPQHTIDYVNNPASTVTVEQVPFCYTTQP